MVTNSGVDLHAKIREVREKEKLTQDSFSRIFNITIKRIKDIESIAKPDVDLLISICTKYKLSFRYFVIPTMKYEEGLKLGRAEELLDLLCYLPENYSECIRSMASAYARWKDQNVMFANHDKRFSPPK